VCGTRGSGLVSASVVLVVCACVVSAASAQTVAAPDLKAAFLFNFAKFAEWPADVVSTNAPIILCVVGDGDVANALEKTVRGHNVDGHPLVVARAKADSLPTCHLLYVTGLDDKRSVQLLHSLKGLAVFTVSDFELFAQLGGVAQFFVENGKMRFAINPDSAQRAHLTLSSKLLSLAKLVKGRSE
jgi:hypothetical protein